jgi:multidrug transporter EmrE-like cation transporter
MKVVVLPLILLAVFLNTGAQLLLKAGMNRFGEFEFALPKLINIGTQLVLNPYIMLGFLTYVISVLVWLLVLSRVDVSFAYPMISLGYILNALTAYYLFGEALSLTRMVGILIILCGVYLVARS